MFIATVCGHIALDMCLIMILDLYLYLLHWFLWQCLFHSLSHIHFLLCYPSFNVVLQGRRQRTDFWFVVTVVCFSIHIAEAVICVVCFFLIWTFYFVGYVVLSCSNIIKWCFLHFCSIICCCLWVSGLVLLLLLLSGPVVSLPVVLLPSTSVISELLSSNSFLLSIILVSENDSFVFLAPGSR